MSKQEQVLHIDPAGELRFKGPFNEVVTAELKLTNPSDKRVCFKVKTTAPKRYCVRPNSGIIEPKNNVGVSVMLQPFEYDPAEKNKHKFMVQTMFAPEGKIESQESLWKDIAPDQLMDSKLKCVFEMPAAGDTPSQSPQTTAEAVQEDKVNPVKQDTSFTQPRPDLPATRSDPSKGASIGETDGKKTSEEVRRLQAQVAKLQQENGTLKQEEVRLRKVAMSDTVSSTPAPTPTRSELSDSQTSVMNLPPYLYLLVALILGVIVGKLFL